MTVSFFKFNALFTELARARRLDRIESLIDKLARIDLLMIDDFAFRRTDQQHSEWLYEIVDRRYGTRSIILTSNPALGDWMGVFPDPVIAGAILDRLTHHAHQFDLTHDSVRKILGRKAVQPTIDIQPQPD